MPLLPSTKLYVRLYPSNVLSLESFSLRLTLQTDRQIMANSNFLHRVLSIVSEEGGLDTPLIRFEHPEDLQKILEDDLDISVPVSDSDLERSVRQVLRYSVKTNQPMFRNQLYGAMDEYGLAGAWISEAFNTGQYTFEVAPVFSLIESKIIKHVLGLFGIPEGDGIFSPGGSISIFYALVAARYKAFPDVKRKGVKSLPDLVIFTSEDSHYSIKKGAHWLGFGTDNIRIIKTSDNGQMLIEELDLAIQEELRGNKHPVLVNATAGTTVLGAIDDLEAIADVCKKYGIWMHVDACWGGSLILSQKLKHRLKGIERADSISWNPHKMVGAPLQCSLCLVRCRGLLHEANCSAAQYLFQQDKFYDVSYDSGDKSVQCGRKIDAFKLWMMWKARGDAGFSKLMDNVMEMAEFALDSVSNRPGFLLVTTTLQCPNVCFWYIPRFMRDKERDSGWWNVMHKITPKIKEKLTLSSRLLISYSPVRHYKNFFRLALTFHPAMKKKNILEILQAIEEAGEMITEFEL